MSTVAELKSDIISMVEETTDIEFLKLIQDLFKPDQSVYQLSEEQIIALEDAEKQYQRGEVIPHEEVMKNAREWLNK